MRRLLIGLAFFGLAGTLRTAPLINEVPKGPPPDEVLIVSARDGQPQIYELNVKTKALRKLTNDTSTNSYPAWSPDGKSIAFASDRDGGMNIFVMDADGKNVRQLTRGNDRSRCPSWSPDGKRIAFGRSLPDPNGNLSCGVFVMDTDGGNLRRVGEQDAWNPAWSPDGTKILFGSKRDGGGFRIYEMDADGANPRQLTENANPYGSVYPCYSPDGKKILWTDGDDDALELHVADADGKNARKLTKEGGMSTFACWSPDGKAIVFQHMPDGQSGPLLLMNADGSGRRELVNNEPLNTGARIAWKPR